MSTIQTDDRDIVHSQFESTDPTITQVLTLLNGRQHYQIVRAGGLLDSTLVVLTTEFGRSPKINDRTGRDHHPAVYSSLLAGGGIKAGHVHGEPDEKGHFVNGDEVRVPDFNATIAHAMGIPLKENVISNSGRPFTVTDDGEAVMDLFA